MNIYDFDGTIYNGDSTRRFYFFCVKKYPFLLKFIPNQLWGMILYIFGRISKEIFKEYFFSFLEGIKDPLKEVDVFWELESSRIKQWYLKIKNKDDLIISASPEFILKIICDKLDILPPIASLVDYKTGKYIGLNCKGKEKVKRLKERCSQIEVENVYSDSKTDIPLFKIAQNCYLVKKEKIIPYKFNVNKLKY